MKEKGKTIIHLSRPSTLITNMPFVKKIFDNYLRNNPFRLKLTHLRHKLRNISKGSPIDLFYTILIETNPVCNRKCSYCPNAKNPRKGKLMSEEIFYKIIDELSEINFKGKICPHFFGEPLLDKRLPKLLKYAKDKLPNVRIVIYTNGDLLTIDLFKELVKLGVNIIEVTEHDEKVSENMKIIFNFLDKNPIYKKHLNYRRNLYIDERAGLVKSGFEKRARKICTTASYNMTINYKGDIILCCNDYFGKYKFGNVAKEKLIDIWNKKGYRKIRQNNMNGKFSLDICKNCKE